MASWYDAFWYSYTLGMEIRETFNCVFSSLAARRIFVACHSFAVCHPNFRNAEKAVESSD
eukprot:scaffold6749_cov113-Cylindrotheca_fusiformis.AAC.6